MSERDTVSYEWVAEETDEGGDIVNVNFADDLVQAKRLASMADTPTCPIALVRRVGNDFDGEKDRHYAYLRDDGTLPERFSEPGFDDERGPSVPKRFHTEVRKAG